MDEKLPYDVVLAGTNTGKFWARRSLLKRRGKAYVHVGKKFYSANGGKSTIEEIVNEVKNNIELL